MEKGAIDSPTDDILSDEVIARTESFYGIRAGIARLSDVLKGYSYQVGPEDEEHTNHMDEVPVNDDFIHKKSSWLSGKHKLQLACYENTVNHINCKSISFTWAF